MFILIVRWENSILKRCLIELKFHTEYTDHNFFDGIVMSLCATNCEGLQLIMIKKYIV